MNPRFWKLYIWEFSSWKANLLGVLDLEDVILGDMVLGVVDSGNESWELYVLINVS